MGDHQQLRGLAGLVVVQLIAYKLILHLLLDHETDWQFLLLCKPARKPGREPSLLLREILRVRVCARGVQVHRPVALISHFKPASVINRTAHDVVDSTFNASDGLPVLASDQGLNLVLLAAARANHGFGSVRISVEQDSLLQVAAAIPVLVD